MTMLGVIMGKILDERVFHGGEKKKMVRCWVFGVFGLYDISRCICIYMNEYQVTPVTWLELMLDSLNEGTIVISIDMGRLATGSSAAEVL